MDSISEEFLAARTGEVLEARLRNNEKFQQQMKCKHEASRAFSKDSDITKKCWKLYDTLENEWMKYNIMYGEESYRLGFEDGVQIASEKEIRAKGTVLPFKDMTHLIYLYDAIKKLNMFLVGKWEICDRDNGILKELDRVWKVIEDSPVLKLGCGERMKCLNA